MSRYLDRIAGTLGSLAASDETVVAAIPANGSGAERGPGRLARSAPVAGGGTGVLVREHAVPAELPFGGRMVLVATDRRLRVYERRRWRPGPARHLGDLPLASLGNVEGTYDPSNGVEGLGLTLILSDATAVTLEVPPGFRADGKEFVQRLQLLLRG